MPCKIKYKNDFYTESQAEKVIGSEQFAESILSKSKDFNKLDNGNYFIKNKDEALSTIRSINSNLDGPVITLKYNSTELLIDASVLLLNKEYLPSVEYKPKTKVEQLKLNLLKNAFPGTKVIIDNSKNSELLGIRTEVYKSMVKNQEINQGQPVISINEERLSEDTLEHEFGHLYIDILEGQGYKQIINDAIAELKDSVLWNQIASNPDYADLPNIGKEVLATALGLETNEIFNKNIDKSKFELLIDRLLSAIAGLLGQEKSYVKQLANTLMSDHVAKGLKIQATTKYSQKQSSNSKEETLKRLQDTSRVIQIGNRMYVDKFNNGQIEKNSAFVAKTTVTRHVNKGSTFIASQAAKDIAIKNLRMAYNDSTLDETTLSEQLSAEFLQEVRAIEEKWEKDKIFGITIHEMMEDYMKYDSINFEYYFPVESFSPEIVEKYRNIFNNFKTVLYRIKQEALRQNASIIMELPIYSRNQDMSGKIDMLIAYKDGSVKLFDLKAMVIDAFSGNGLSGIYKASRLEKHSKQLMVYKRILESEYNVETKGLEIIPLKVERNNSGVVTDVKVYDRNINILSQKESNTWLKDVYTEIPNPNNPLDHLNFYEINFDKSRSTKEIKSFNDLKKAVTNFITLITAQRADKKLIDQIQASLNIINRDLSTVGVKKFALETLDLLADNYAKFRQDKGTGLLFEGKINEYTELTNYLTGVENILSSYNSPDLNKTISLFSQYSRLFKAEINEYMKDVAVDVIAPYMNQILGKFKIQYSDEFVKNNPRKSSNLITKDYNKAKEAYINQKLTDNKQYIDAQIKEAARKYVEVVPEDISMLSRFILNKDKLNDNFTKTIVAIAKRIRQSVSRRLHERRKSFKPSFSEFLKDKSHLAKFNSKELYKDFLVEDKEGNLLPYLISEYDSNFMLEHNKMNLAVQGIKNAINKLFQDKYALERKITKSGNLETNKEYAKELIAIKDKITLANNNIVDVKNKFRATHLQKDPDNSSKYIPNTILYKTEEHTKRYNKIKNNPVYLEFLQMNREADNSMLSVESTRGNSTINLDMYNTVFHRLPSVSKSKAERIIGFKLNQATQEVKDFFKQRVDNDELRPTMNVSDDGTFIGENGIKLSDTGDYVFTEIAEMWDDVKEVQNNDLLKIKQDSKGSEIFEVPIRYRGLLGDTYEEHMQNQSFNLADIFFRNYKMAINFQEKSQAEAQIKHLYNTSKLIDTLDKSKVNEKSIELVVENVKIDAEGKKTIKEIIQEVFPFTVKKETQRIKSLESTLKYMFYEIPLWGTGKWSAGRKISKYFDAIMYHANLGLSIGQITDFTNGIAQIWTNFTKYGDYQSNDFWKAFRQQSKDSTQQLLDTGRLEVTSKINLNLELLGANYSGVEKAYRNQGSSIVENKIRNFNPFSTMMAGYGASDKFKLGLLSSVILNDIKILNQEGQYLNKEGKVVKSQKEALNLNDALIRTIKIKDSKGKVKEVEYNPTIHTEGNKEIKLLSSPYLKALDIAKFTDYRGKEVNEELYSDLRDRLAAKYEELEGYYTDNKPELAHTLGGEVLLKFKNFFIPYFNRRYAGSLSILKSDDELFGIERDQEGNIDWDKSSSKEALLNYNNDLGKFELGYQVQMLRTLGLAFNKYKDNVLVAMSLKNKSEDAETEDFNKEFKQELLAKSIKNSYYTFLMMAFNTIVKGLLTESWQGEDEEEAIEKYRRSIENTIRANEDMLEGEENQDIIDSLKEAIKEGEKILKKGITIDMVPKRNIYSNSKFISEGGKKPDKIGFQYGEIPGAGLFVDKEDLGKFIPGLSLDNTDAARRFISVAAVVSDRMQDESTAYDFSNLGAMSYNTLSTLGSISQNEAGLGSLMSLAFSPFSTAWEGASKTMASPSAGIDWASRVFESGLSSNYGSSRYYQRSIKNDWLSFDDGSAVPDVVKGQNRDNNNLYNFIKALAPGSAGYNTWHSLENVVKYRYDF